MANLGFACFQFRGLRCCVCWDYVAVYYQTWCRSCPIWCFLTSGLLFETIISENISCIRSNVATSIVHRSTSNNEVRKGKKLKRHAARIVRCRTISSNQDCEPSRSQSNCFNIDWSTYLTNRKSTLWVHLMCIWYVIFINSWSSSLLEWSRKQLSCASCSSTQSLGNIVQSVLKV